MSLKHTGRRRMSDTTERSGIMAATITTAQDQDGMFVVECPTIPGRGRTREEGEANIRDAIRECLAVRAGAGISSLKSDALDRFAALVRSALGPKLVELRLFGSVARGDAGPDSDIDVLVVVQPESERRALANQVIDIAFDVNLACDVYISPRVVSPDILNHPVWRETPFLRNVARESVPL